PGCRARRVPDVVPSDARIPWSVLCLAGELLLPAGAVPFGTQPNRPGHAHLVDREDSAHQRPSVARRTALPGAVLQPAAGAGDHADDSATEVDHAAAGRRADGRAAKDDAIHHVPDVWADVLQDASRTVPVFRRQHALGPGRAKVDTEEKTGQ